VKTTPSKRRIDSYEQACRLLQAQPLEPSEGPLPEGGQFDQMTPAQFKQLAAHSLPPPIRVVAFQLDPERSRPYAVAEFAAELLLERESKRLRLAEPGNRPPFSERANLRWIVWGDLIAGPGGHLALGPLSIGPHPGAETALEPGTPPYRGVTSEVLRAIPIERLIREIVSQLRRVADWQRHLAGTYGWQPSAEQQQFADAIKRAEPDVSDRRRKYPDDHYRSVALLYLQLLAQGHGSKPIADLANKLGVTRTTARNWIHRARQLGYLTQGTRGKPGANAGPRL
jgi:hypothetical protein